MMINCHQTTSIIAKCALCSTKTELFICSHCDKVICQLCIDNHQSKLNEKLKQQWDLCTREYSNLLELLNFCGKQIINIETQMDQIRSSINQRFTDIIQSIEHEKNNLLNEIDENRQSYQSINQHEDLEQLFHSISQRLDAVFQDPKVSYNVDDFLLEIEHLKKLINNHEKKIEINAFKYPCLSPSKPMSISDIFGELQWNSMAASHSTSTRSSITDSPNFNSRINEYRSTNSINEYPEEMTTVSEITTSNHIIQRQKQWTIDAAGVPHFLCVLSKKNHLLFACDKFGSIDLYQLDSNEAKNSPRHLRQFELFPGNTTSQQPQIIETFTVYTPFIVVAAHLNDQADSSSIYFFDHRGLKQTDKYVQNFPVRQLSADISTKYLWGIDRRQHSIYYHHLPMNVQQISDFLGHREDLIKFSRDFEPIRITQNRTSIGIVERNYQKVHIYNKQTKQHIDEIQNLLRTKGIFRLWNALLRDDNSMILKLDEDLPPNSRPSSINHIILELDSNGLPTSQIERISVYGLSIGPNQEILLGCKRNQQHGLIECYI